MFLLLQKILTFLKHTSYLGNVRNTRNQWDFFKYWIFYTWRMEMTLTVWVYIYECLESVCFWSLCCLSAFLIKHSEAVWQCLVLCSVTSQQEHRWPTGCCFPSSSPHVPDVSRAGGTNWTINNRRTRLKDKCQIEQKQLIFKTFSALLWFAIINDQFALMFYLL